MLNVRSPRSEKYACSRFFVIALGCLILLTCTSVAGFAQSLAGLGAITGTVHDASGGAVPGASVEVINHNLGIDRKLVATDAGLFSAPSLPPAAGYTVIVNAPRFNTSRTDNIVLHVGEEVALPVQLTIASAQQTVTVSETSEPIVDTVKTEVSDLINEQQLENLPINGRRADQFALLAPGVVPDATSGEVSFHGVPSGNQFLIDGVDITQQWFVQNAGGEALLSNISMDAVQEFRTELAGYSAEFGRGAGGVVNILTKSGTNQLHGTGFWYFRNRTLNATDLYSKLLVNGVSEPYNPPEYRHQFGGTVGGPIKKDKLFFFSSYEGTIRNFPLVSNMFSEGAYLNITTGQLLPGVCNATAAQCAAVQTFINRLSIPSVIARELHQNAGFAKFTYNQSDKSTFNGFFNLVNYSATHDGTTLAATTDGTGASGENYNVSTHVRNAHLSNTYLVSNSMVNFAAFGWNADRRFQGLPTDLAPPDDIHSSLTVAGIGTFGVSLNQLPNIQPTEDRYDLSDNFSIIKGKHEMKFGADYAYLRSVENAVFSGPGGYTYANFTNFAYDLTPDAATDPVSGSAPYSSEGKHYSTFAQAVGHPITRITIRDYDFFAQDTYHVLPALSLNLGLRYEYATFTQPPPPTYAATDNSVGKINQPKLDFAPRVGFSYALNNNKTVIRGSYGIFYNRLPGATITRLQQLGGTVRKSFTLSDTNATQFAAAPTFPNTFTSLSQVNSVLSPSSINSGFALRSLGTPYVQEWSLGVERALTSNMSLNVSYVGTRGLKFLQRSDLNAGPPTGVDTFAVYNAQGTQTGTYSTPVYFNAANGNTTYNSNYNKILQIDNGGRLWYDGLIVEFHQRANKYIQSNIAYTYSHSEDLGQGTFSSNYYFTDQGDTYFNGSSIINGKSGYAYEKGSSLEDMRHRIVMSAEIHAPDVSGSEFKQKALNGWQLAPIFTYATPQFVDSYLTVGGASVGSGAGQVPASAIPAGDKTTTADQRLYVPTPTLSGIGAETPGGSRVPFLPTANLPLGHTVEVDGRLTKQFPFHERDSVELSFEAINALNHIRNTGVVQTVYKSLWDSTANTGYLVEQTKGGAGGWGAGAASGGFPDGTNARRAQASVRITF